MEGVSDETQAEIQHLRDAPLVQVVNPDPHIPLPPLSTSGRMIRGAAGEPEAGQRSAQTSS